MTEPLQTSPITLAELEEACQRFVFIPGHLDVGASVRYPHGDHEHRILTTLHSTLAENITIIATDTGHGDATHRAGKPDTLGGTCGMGSGRLAW